MYQRLISISCIMVLMIVFIPTTARSESWVLWQKKEFQKIDLTSNIYWEILDAYPDYKQCMQTMKRIWQVEKTQALEDKKKFDTISEIKDVPYNLLIRKFKEPKEYHSIWEHFYCLPGTLDPREKK